MKKQTFEEYLNERFMLQYHGDKEHYEDSFDRWLADLDGEDYIKLAQQWGDIITF